VKLLRELANQQKIHGFLSTQLLQELADQWKQPYYQLESLVSYYPHFRRTAAPKTCIHVCRDVCCKMAGGKQALQNLQQHFRNDDGVEIKEVSCLGRCDCAPAALINDDPIAPNTLRNWGVIMDLIDQSAQPDPPAAAKQIWKVDPYTENDEMGETTRKLVAASHNLSDVTIESLTLAQLRGMGGAGFPTGKKWEFVAKEEADQKYVICNADESEPGTFKDRVILSELPHLVIEGMLLAALTIGADRGIIFLRHEYHRELSSIEWALEQARDFGLLGENAAGSGKRFDIEIFLSPGGYILGEETALLECLEDKRGEPRNKPPYPGQYGLWGQPTLINNVETFALATSIIHHGADWWQNQGRGEYAGLKFVSISGDVCQPGVYEIPIGTSVRELIDLAGGMLNDKPLKAYLPGGASSKFLTAEHLDVALEFGAMQQAGSMLGTGAVIVISEERDLYSLATNIVNFFRNESCGQCVPCRVGTQRASELLDDVAAGNRAAIELEELPLLDETLQQTSICGLGHVALHPVTSMMQHFPDEIPNPII